MTKIYDASIDNQAWNGRRRTGRALPLRWAALGIVGLSVLLWGALLIPVFLLFGC